MNGKIQNAKWFPYMIAAVTAVVLYVLLTHLKEVFGAIGGFLGYFSSVFLGCVLAYLMNPLADLYRRRVFHKVPKEKLRWTLSVVLTIITVVLVLAFILGTLIPQLIDSVKMLAGNMDSYIDSLQGLIGRLDKSDTLKLEQLLGSSGDFVDKIGTYLMENVNRILNYSAAAGKGVVKWVIAFILSAYLLMAKKTVMAGIQRLCRALMPPKRYEAFHTFFDRSDKILVQYIACSLLDALIIGTVNAIFMAIARMQYVGLVSMVVAATNLIPTFGPLVGGAIGGFILLLVNPIHALIFVIFTMVLQFMDGYVIKPKLFGNRLGVSGLLILIAVIVGGNMFGVVGILLGIPTAAILDFIYEEEILPALEKHRQETDKPKAPPAPAATPPKKQ